MDSDFVEEFDSSSESESGESSAKPPKLSEFVSSTAPLYHPPYNPLQSYHHIPQHPVNYSFGFPFPIHDHGYPSPSPYYFNSDFFSPPRYPYYASDILYQSTTTTPVQVIETGGIGKRKRKTRRNRKKVKLSDYDDSVRSHAWRIYQKKMLESKLKQCTNEEESQQITRSLEAIKKDLSTYATPQDESAIQKIVKKIKTQRRKRLREKLQRKHSSEENQKNFELAKKREAEIDKWLKDQATLFEAEIQRQILLKEAKKSLSEVGKKREMIEGRMTLLSNLQKLREIRKKEKINTQPGFSATSTLTSDQEFVKGLSSLKEMLQQELIKVQEEEKTIRVKMTPLSLPSASTSDTQGTQGGCSVPNKCTGGEVENKKLKRQMKWEKWLRKKTTKQPYF